MIILFCIFVIVVLSVIIGFTLIGKQIGGVYNSAGQLRPVPRIVVFWSFFVKVKPITIGNGPVNRAQGEIMYHLATSGKARLFDKMYIAQPATDFKEMEYLCEWIYLGKKWWKLVGKTLILPIYVGTEK